MPYIVENSLGIAFNGNLYFGPNTINFGTTQSDTASASSVDLYTSNTVNFGVSNLYSNDLFINGPLYLRCENIVATSQNIYTIEPPNHVIFASYSTGANNSEIWLGTASRIEGMEIIIRRLDGNSGTTVNVRSSQTDISTPIGSDTSTFQLTANFIQKIVRIGGKWRRY